VDGLALVVGDVGGWGGGGVIDHGKVKMLDYALCFILDATILQI
jgi:hypothetical protein